MNLSNHLSDFCCVRCPGTYPESSELPVRQEIHQGQGFGAGPAGQVKGRQGIQGLLGAGLGYGIGLFLGTHLVQDGQHPVHVAVIAKKWRALFNYVRQATRMNAVEYARENGFQAVTCGHIHYAEDTYVDGIRYINTGSWTETPTYCVIVNHERISLMKTEEWIP